MPWVRRGDVGLYVERAGTGPPLLVISGTGADLRVPPSGFDFPFAGSFDLTSYDQRGLGQSSHPTPDGSWSMADYADDAAAVLDWAGWQQAAVMGISFGGMVAQELLIRHPGRVSRAVLACTSSGGAGGSPYPLHELTAMGEDDRAARYLGLMDTRWADPEFQDPLRSFLEGRLAGQATPDDDSLAGAAAQLQARSRHDTWERLPAVRAPVLVAAGRYDGIAPLVNSQSLAAAIPGSRLAVFEGGHAFMYQDQAAFAVMGDHLAG